MVGAGNMMFPYVQQITDLTIQGYSRQQCSMESMDTVTGGFRTIPSLEVLATG